MPPTPEPNTAPLGAEPVLVCFAVKEEAKFFKPLPCHRTLVTGMGRINAVESFRKALDSFRPKCVLTCGFAGGLNPLLELNEVVFDADEGSGLGPRLLAQKARAARFCCAKRVAITVEEKQRLWRATGFDAIEMESEAIREICREQKIPAATVRVISDTARENLPLDFNTLLNAEQKIDFKKLGFQLLRSPRKIAELMEFQKQTVAAAKALADLLQRVLGS